VSETVQTDVDYSCVIVADCCELYQNTSENNYNMLMYVNTTTIHQSDEVTKTAPWSCQFKLWYCVLGQGGL